MGGNLAFMKGKGEGGEGHDKKILFLGLDNAGKTTILFKIKDDEFKDTVPTVGLNVEQVSYKDMTLTLWDVGGQARKLWKHYYDKVDGVIMVIDSADIDRMKIVKDELSKIVVEPGLETVPILILANKQDLDGALTKAEISELLNIKELNRKNMIFHSCSAKTGDGLWDGLEKLAGLWI